MRIGNRVICKKTGEYGIILDVMEKNNHVYFKVAFDNGKVEVCAFKTLYQII